MKVRREEGGGGREEVGRGEEVAVRIRKQGRQA